VEARATPTAQVALGEHGWLRFSGTDVLRLYCGPKPARWPRCWLGAQFAEAVGGS